jgi:cell division control protein 6
VLPSTPSTSLSGLSLVTPPGTPSALIPLHVRARSLLRATCNSTTAIFGRASERDKITKFLASFVTGSDSDASTSTLYVSGLPGTGKTALVNDILRTTDMSDVVVVNLNCMALNNADALWDRLQEDLGVMKKARGRGRPKKLDAKATVAKILEGSSTKW